MPPSSLVALRNGPAVPADVLRFAWDLEERGLDLRVNNNGRLLVGPRSRITAEDRELIRAHSQTLAVIVRYADQVIA